MRTVQTHLTEILGVVRPVPPLDVVLGDAAGCILNEAVQVAADVPAFAGAGYDGYAVRSDDVAGANEAAPAALPVVHDVWSGGHEPVRLVPGQAIRISSGAPVPVGADAVVPLASTDRGAATVRIFRPVAAGTGVRPAGVDAQAGQTALAAGIRLGARQISLAAALGRSRLCVHPRPRVVIMPVGDDLRLPGAGGRAGSGGRTGGGGAGRHPGSGSSAGGRAGSGVFEANAQALAIAVQDAGAVAIPVAPVPDEHGALRDAIEDQLVRADLIITTGGLSEGAHDTIKDVLGPLGTVRFDHVAMAPGRSHGFGRIRSGDSIDDGGGDPTADGSRPGDATTGGSRAGESRAGELHAGDGSIPIFALPGHPVAAQIAYEVFVRPALLQMAGHADLFRPSVAAYADAEWSSPAGRREFVPALLKGSPNEGYRVTPVGDPGELEQLSLSALAHANALAVIGEDETQVRLGARVFCLVLDG